MNPLFYKPTARISSVKGFTLIELVLVIVIVGLLATTALRTGGALFETAKVEETRQEMDALAVAIAGNATLYNNGVRADFGYVGDVGALPPNLDALYANPGGFATWNGPYISNRFTQNASDFKTDAWGAPYAFAGVSIASTGSSNMVRQIAGSAAELLLNRTSGTVLDADGTPPGVVYSDSVAIRIQYPNGAGSTASRSMSPDPGGYFVFDSLPIGNHPVTIVYSPTSDTLYRLVSIPAGSAPYAEYRLPSNVWYDTTVGGGIILVPNSDSLMADCRGFTFWILNTSGGPVVISDITVTYSGLTAYYRYVRWNGTIVVDEHNPSIGSGEIAAFGTPQTIDGSESVRITIDSFKSNPTGGAGVDVDNTTFTVLLSDGSTFELTTGGCP